VHNFDVYVQTQFLSLNSSAAHQFFLFLRGRTAVFQVSESIQPTLESLLKSEGITCKSLASQQTYRKASLPLGFERKYKSGFWKSLAAEVTKQAFGSAVGAVVTGLISGAASCTVM